MLVYIRVCQTGQGHHEIIYNLSFVVSGKNGKHIFSRKFSIPTASLTAPQFRESPLSWADNRGRGRPIASLGLIISFSKMQR